MRIGDAGQRRQTKCGMMCGVGWPAGLREEVCRESLLGSDAGGDRATGSGGCNVGYGGSGVKSENGVKDVVSCVGSVAGRR